MSASVWKLSVICPAFQEEVVLPRFHAELATVLDALPPEYQTEVIYVDDGSDDGTLQVLRALAASDRRVHYLSLSRNFGHQAAITAGLEHSSGDAIITLDSDLQHPPALIPTLLAKWREGNDIVMTLREEDPDLGPVKRVTSRAFFEVMRYLSETEMRIAASDYRLMSRRAVDSLLRFPETHRFLRGMVHWLGYPTATVRFQVASRGAGHSKFTFRRLFAFAIDALLSFSKLPLRMSFILGMLFLACGTVYFGYELICALLGRAVGWELVLAMVVVVGGCTLASLGILGEYVGRVYEQVKGRPLYLLKEQWPQSAAQHGVLDSRSGRPPDSAAA
jgi:glycosyltransferase involved in cell wall biosynthesis